MLCALILFGVIRSAVATRLDGFTYDEPWHIAAGASYAFTGDFRLNPEHPPLVKLWVGAALPGVLRVPPFRVLLDKPDERRFVEGIVYLQNDAHAVQQRARWAMLGFHALLLLWFTLAARRVFGDAMALGALAFLVVDPTIAAHMPLVMTDLPVALLSGVALLAAIVAFRTWRARDLALLALPLGLALAAKHSGSVTAMAVVALGGAAAISAPVGSGLGVRARRLGRLAAVLVGALVVLWGCYGFRFQESRAPGDCFNRPLSEKIDDVKSPWQQQALRLVTRAQLLPRAYIWGLADVIRAGIEGRKIPVTFFGREHGDRTPWYFFPGVLLVKLPLGLLGLVLLGAILLALRRVRPDRVAPLGCMLAMAGVFLAFLALSNSGYAGVRHALAVVPVLALLAALAVETAVVAKPRILRASAAVASAAALASALPVMRPWEYYNELVGGGPNAHRYFNDEGLDMGQRSEELVRYYEAQLRPAGEIPFDEYGLNREERERREVRTFSWEDAEPDSDVLRGTVFLSASSLAPQRIFDYAAFREARPVARLGNLLIYRGEFHLPWRRAGKRLWRAFDLLYSEKRDAATAERLLAESVALYPQAYPAAIELGNLLIEHGARDEAIRAYRIARAHAPPGDEIVEELVRQIDRVATAPPAAVVPLRNPWLE